MFYRQSIILFGFVVPFAVCAAIVGGGIFLKSKFTASFHEKQALYKTAENDRIGSLGIEAQISKKRPHMDHWFSQFEKETSNAISSHLKQIGDDLPPKEFQRTAVEYPTGKAGFGSISAQRSSQVRLAFRGTFRSVQLAFAELESQMPQLQLNDLRIDPSSGSTSSLNFQVNYTAWEK
ncbi:hypothetical protein OKA04_06930 [Luteolibacter flavescens]|uniref:Type 4a pilus biogenesis protein PilO n=1 Tax=Luteolibacter flavescens TaxID=1859460 RepID=A0ABT3FM85_9BACT|nr:hypothetical protein [Luteolibacter flavescens]MCW1884459.1 hypothetical protein [Luteolibacter flavescens]